MRLLVIAVLIVPALVVWAVLVLLGFLFSLPHLAYAGALHCPDSEYRRACGCAPRRV